MMPRLLPRTTWSRWEPGLMWSCQRRHDPCERGFGRYCQAALEQGGHAHIRQNLFFAFIYNAVGVPVAGVLYPVFGVLLNPSSPGPR